MKNIKIIVRKDNDGDGYTAFGYIRLFTGGTGFIHFEGLTFAEAINKVLEY